MTDDQTSRNSTPGDELPSLPGFTWELLCVACLGISALSVTSVFFILMVNNKNPWLSPIVALVLLLLLLKLTPWLTNKYRIRQRRALLKADEVMKLDKRPPVLYLRSFKDDKSIARAIAFYSIEQEMKSVLSEIGPFIAFGDLDEEPLDPGAARKLVPHKQWHDDVRREMSKARLVIMRVADSKGFWWEVEEAPKIVDAEQLVFLIPPERLRGYELFRERASRLLHCQLPEFEIKWSPFGPHGGIIYFEPDWTPHLQRFKTVWLRQTFWNLFGAMLKIGLKPVYEQLGVKWTKPPVQPAQVLLMLMLVLLSALAVYMLYAFFNQVCSIL